jgi:predicted RND superfamily exporter protein
LNFPVPPAAFVSLLANFIATPAAVKAQYDKDVGLKELSAGVRRIEWMKISTLIDLEKMAAAAVASSVFEEWESFIELVNRGSPPGVNRAFQTSLLWVRMVTEQTILTQFQRSVIFSVIICFVSLIVFTKNIVMALYASLSVAGIMICVIGFILTAGWKIGLIEALCLMLLIGFSVDYVLHISHAFSGASQSSCSQYESVRRGVGSIGLSIFSSAMTTTISSIPLLFCTIQLFAKIGALVIMSTILSLMFSMAFFVALLASFGPSNEHCGFGCFRKSGNLAHTQLEDAGLDPQPMEPEPPSDTGSHEKADGVEMAAPHPVHPPLDDDGEVAAQALDSDPPDSTNEA